MEPLTERTVKLEVTAKQRRPQKLSGDAAFTERTSFQRTPVRP